MTDKKLTMEHISEKINAGKFQQGCGSVSFYMNPFHSDGSGSISINVETPPKKLKFSNGQLN